MNKLFDPSKEMLKIKSMIEEAPDGAYITYEEIENHTGVKMDNRGKSLMRSAFRSLHRYYRPDSGKGVEIESPDNTMSLVTTKIKRVDGALKGAMRTTTTLHARHRQKLNQDDRSRIDATVSLFGAIQAMATGLSKIYKEKPEALNTISQGSISWKTKP